MRSSQNPTTKRESNTLHTGSQLRTGVGVCLFVFSKMKIRAWLYRHHILVPGPRVRCHIFAQMSTTSPPARNRNSFSDQKDNLRQNHMTPKLEISHCDQIPRQDSPSTSFLAKNSVNCIYYIILYTS